MLLLDEAQIAFLDLLLIGIGSLRFYLVLLFEV